MSPSFRDSGLTLRQAAIVAGLGYLLNPVTYAEFNIAPKLIIPGHVDQTIANISANPRTFVIFILCYLVNFIGDIVIAWALYYLFAPVNRAISLLAALFRLMYTAIALAGWFNLVIVYRMLTNPEYQTVFGTGPLQAQVDLMLHAFRYDWAISIEIFALHLVLIGVLIFRSGYVPKWLGIALILDGIAWIVSNLAPYLYPRANLGLLQPFFWIELVFMLWLLIFGWRIPEPATV
jgi:hypothetical protein